ncbi:MAG TPA: hypothetical protein VG943_10805 [Caulobacterales bacterium]|nr:hypothetical protein [Caulobacterales bacterium]
MRIDLPHELEVIVERLRATGQFASDAEIFRAALVDLERRAIAWADKHAALKQAIDQGLEGPAEPWDMDDIRREVAERLAGRAAAE